MLVAWSGEVITTARDSVVPAIVRCWFKQGRACCHILWALFERPKQAYARVDTMPCYRTFIEVVKRQWSMQTQENIAAVKLQKSSTGDRYPIPVPKEKRRSSGANLERQTNHASTDMDNDLAKKVLYNTITSFPLVGMLQVSKPCRMRQKKSRAYLGYAGNTRPTLRLTVIIFL